MNLNHPIISGDSHLEVDSSRWLHRVPAEYRDVAPHTVRMPNGGDAWVVDNSPPVEAPFDLYGGKGRNVWTPYGQNYDDLAGSGTPEQRIQEQEKGGLDAEVLYPNEASGPKLWRKIRDDTAYNAVVHAYNDWLAEEYCVVNSKRLIGLGVLPYSSMRATLNELEHCAQLGLKGVILNGFPNGHGYPMDEDDQFWKETIDMNMPVAIHVDLDRTGDRAGPLFKYPVQNSDALQYTDLVAQVARFGRAAGTNAIQLVISGLFDRFPYLNVMMAENQCGWVPFYMSQADVRYRRHIDWSQRLLGYKPLAQLPSYYLKNNCWWGFQIDPIGVELRHHMRVDHLVWASDFPHQESEWPYDHDVLQWNFQNVPSEEVRQMVCSNAAAFFHLDLN